MPNIVINHSYTVSAPEYGTPMDVDEIVSLVNRSGSHFFDADTMRFFRSRVAPDSYTGKTGWYFITSEQNHGFGGTYPRLYTVRCLKLEDYDGKPGIYLYELEGFQYFSSLRRARTAALHAARTNPRICPQCSLRLMTETSQSLCAECQQREAR